MSAESPKALSRSDFLICGWRDVIKAADKEVRFSSSAFYEAATRCEQTGDLACTRILRLIGPACSMMLVPGKINDPFAPVLQDLIIWSLRGRAQALGDTGTVIVIGFALQSALRRLLPEIVASDARQPHGLGDRPLRGAVVADHAARQAQRLGGRGQAELVAAHPGVELLM